jgi:hypothetical protein
VDARSPTGPNLDIERARNLEVLELAHFEIAVDIRAVAVVPMMVARR